MDDYLTRVFGESGLLSRRVAGYQPRPAQVAVAQFIDRAMQSEQHALIEAPCGTGKSLAYLAPAVRNVIEACADDDEKDPPSSRAVIVTANIALQEQLIEKDLPLLARALPYKFRYALLKGRSNYLCNQRRWGELVGKPELEPGSQAAEIASWATRTATGDVSELPFVPAPGVWARFSVSSEDCTKSACRYKDGCFAELAVTAARQAHVVVTNYHMLFAHFECAERVLPPFDYLILDEAHEAADIAREWYGFSISPYSLRRFIGAAERLRADAIAGVLRQQGERFFRALVEHAQSPEYHCRLRQPPCPLPEELTRALRELAKRLAAAAEQAQGGKEATVLEDLSRQARKLVGQIEDGVSLSDDNKVYWLELDAKQVPRLRAKPIDVGAYVSRSLFQSVPSTTLVSATLTAAGSFDFVRRELGIPAEVSQLSVDSHSTSSGRP